MTAYIKLSTNEYPRHDGDIAIDPAGAADYEAVQWTEPPVFDGTTQRCLEGSPVQEDGIWKMTWVVREATQEEIDHDQELRTPPLFLKE